MMGVNTTEFEAFEEQFLELIEEHQTLTASVSRLRESVRVEATRAEAAEAARDTATRAEAEARSAAAAASAGAAQASVNLAEAHDQLAATKMQFELAERHRVVLEEKCSGMSSEVESLKRELQKLRPLQTVQTNLQRQYAELQERIHHATLDARKECTRLEAELRRVEKCASGGAEVRDRARLAAAAHVRERRLAAAELHHANQELHNAKAEATKLAALVAELQCRLAAKSLNECVPKTTKDDPQVEALAEVRAALEAERAGAARLEQALAAALADNAVLAARLNATENAAAATTEPPQGLTRTSSTASAKNNPIDSFLAE